MEFDQEVIKCLTSMSKSTVDIDLLKQKLDGQLETAQLKNQIKETEKQKKEISEQSTEKIQQLQMSLEAFKCILAQLIVVVESFLPIIKERVAEDDQGLKQIEVVLMLAKTLSNQQFIDIEQIKQTTKSL